MHNIEKAIQKEKEYLFYRATGEEPFHLADAVKECGFASLAEYFETKLEYQFDELNFDFAEVPPSEAIAEIFRMMDARETKVLFVPSNETFVFTGKSKAFDEEYCKENGIAIYPLYTNGGTIVSTSGDFSLVICMPKSICSGTFYVLNKLKGIFDKFMQDVKVDGNDILLDGRKICGSVAYTNSEIFCFAAHFSFKDNSELIEKICGVSGSVKVPTAIKGMTTENFKTAVSTWLRINKGE